MTEQDPQSVEAEGPGGFKIKARGTDLIAIIMMICGVIGILMLHQHMQASEASAVALRQEIRDSQKESAAAVVKVAESYQELAYMMGLTPEARARLNLEMPESMRRRLRDR